VTVHPPSTADDSDASRHSAPARRPCGTHQAPLTAASFRIWPGSRSGVAQDPTFNASRRQLPRTFRASGGDSAPL